MIKVGQLLKPYSARVLDGGKKTQFSIPQYHRSKDGEIHKDGFINILVNGNYPWAKGSNDQIKLLEVLAVSIWKANGNQYVGIVAKIEYVTAEEDLYDRPDGSGSWSEDIPEELL